MRNRRWNGERLESGRLLIWGEQGVGDEIMFAGLMPDVIGDWESLHAGLRCATETAVRAVLSERGCCEWVCS